MLSLLYLGVKAQQYIFSSSRMSLDKKTLLKTRLNPGLNLTIFRGTVPIWQCVLRILAISSLNSPERHFFFSFYSHRKRLRGRAWSETMLIDGLLPTQARFRSNISPMVYYLHLPNLVSASWSWRISSGTGANQTRRNIFNG